MYAIGYICLSFQLCHFTMGIYFCHVNLTFYVLNTKCNLNPGIEVAHVEMVAVERPALHLIRLNLTNTLHIC